MIVKRETETTHFIGMSDAQIKDLRQFFDAFQVRDLPELMQRTMTYYDQIQPDKISPIAETLNDLRAAIMECTLGK